jgi:hypothetical protein
VPPIGGGQRPGGVTGTKGNVSQYNKGKSDYVPKMAVEEKEQEILAKDETIQVCTLPLVCSIEMIPEFIVLNYNN